MWGGLEDGADLGAGDRAPPVLGGPDHGFERLLAESVGRKPRVAEDRPAAVRGLSEIEFDRHAENHLHEVAEVPAVPLVAHAVGLAVDDVGAEVGRCSAGR